jgi:tRNA(Ile)-lysidine synthetase-like protein
MSLAHLADLAREEEQWWQEEITRQARGVLIEVQGGIEVDASRLTALPRAVARRLIRRGCELAGRGPAPLGFKSLIGGEATGGGAIGRGAGPKCANFGSGADPLVRPGVRPTFEHVEAILELAARPQGDGRLELPGLLVVRSFGWLRFMPPAPVPRPQPVHPSVPGKYAWVGGPTQVCFEIVERDSRQTGCVSLKLSEGRVPAPLELRGWSAGDHYRPAGHSRDQKIKELFQEARVPSWRRRFWPIVSSGPNILWARGFGAAAEFAAAEFTAEDEPGLVLRIWEENT